MDNSDDKSGPETATIDGMTGKPQRARSFVRRSGRKTRSQQRALDELWPAFGIDFEPSPLDLDALFGRNAERVLEIGFGNGDTLVAQAAADPDRDYLGIDVHRPGVGHCLLNIESAVIGNLRLACHDALEVLQQQITDGALARINVYFPDPWPKKRHHKRRLVQQDFLQLAAARLKNGGLLCIATDWQDYAGFIDEVMEQSPQFTLIERRHHHGERPLDRPTTKFERRGLKLGHGIWDWQFERR